MSELDDFTRSRLSSKKTEDKSLMDDFVAKRLASKMPKVNKDEQRGRKLPSPAQGFINAVSQAPLGFGDEIYGALGGLGALVNNAYAAMGGDVEPVGIKDTYLENRDLIRGAQKQYSEDYPWTAGITGAMAGAPLMLAAPFNAPQLPLALTKAQKMFNAAKLAKQAAKTGAVMGGAYGLGTSEGQDIESVATDTAKGAGVGAVAGAVLQPTLSAVGGLSKNLLIRGFGGVKNAGGINQGGQVGAFDPFAGLPEKTRQWMQQQGDVKIAEAIEQTGRANNNVSGQIPYSTVLANKVDKMPVGTPLAALSGDKSNELRSLDAITLLSGRTAPAVAKVQNRLIDTASKRFLNGVNRVLGNGSPDFNKSITALEQKATLESKPFYDILKTTNVVIDDEVRDLVNRSASYAAKANKMARLEGEEFSNILKFVNPASGKTEIPLLQLERLKRAMNGAMKVAKREGDDELVRSILSAKNALMDKLERSAPLTPQGESVYRLANQKFAEPKQLIEQVKEGANIFKKNFMDIRDERALLNAPELEAYNIGVFRALEEKLGSPSGRNFLTDITKNRNTAEQLHETLGGEKYRQLVKILKGERTLKSIYTVNTGSQTAGREAALSELGLDPLKDAGESAALLMSGSPVGAVGKAAQAWNKIAVPEQVRDYMGQQYLLTGKQSQDYLKTLGQMIEQIQAQKVQSASRSGTLGALSTSAPRQDKNQ